ncbi:MAG: mechanosensitive ion channel family protein [Bacteroidia bacterium]
MEFATKTIADLKLQALAVLAHYGGKMVLALISLFIGLWLISKIVYWLNKAMESGNLDKDIRPFFSSLANVSLKVLLLLSVAGVLGIETTSFAAIIGAAGLAIGLALQGSLSNFAGGVLILVFKPFRVGDYVTAQGYSGYVEGIQIFNTLLRTRDNKTIILPNGKLSNEAIVNFSLKGMLRIDMSFSCGIQNNSDKVRAALKKAVDNCPTALKDKEHDIFINKLTDSSMIWDVRVWALPNDDTKTNYFIQEEVKKQFDLAGIEGALNVVINKPF